MTVKVSVLTPIYNTNPQHLRDCLESILNQSFTNFEFLILNDSPNNREIEQIVKQYAKKDKRIIYKKNPTNVGITRSRNELLKMASGEYIAIFDHDDISMPDRLEKEVEYLDTHPHVGVVSCNTEWFPVQHITNHPVDNLKIKVALMRANVVAHTAMMVRKSVLDKYNIAYEEEFSPAEDYMLCLRLIKYTMFHNIPEVLLKYRFEENNTTHKQWEKMVNADALCRCVAMAQYPYLYELANESNKYKNTQTYKWVRLFGIIPFIKIKKYGFKTKYLLFGALPLFYVKG